MDSNTNLRPLDISYRDYVLMVRQLEGQSVFSDDKQYWRDRLASFPIGPDLPLKCSPNEFQKQRFLRCLRTINRSVWQTLKQNIRNSNLSPAGFLASIYAMVLAKWSQTRHFSLNLPIFNRLPIHAQVNQIDGRFHFSSCIRNRSERAHHV